MRPLSAVYLKQAGAGATMEALKVLMSILCVHLSQAACPAMFKGPHCSLPAVNHLPECIGRKPFNGTVTLTRRLVRQLSASYVIPNRLTSDSECHYMCVRGRDVMRNLIARRGVNGKFVPHPPLEERHFMRLPPQTFNVRHPLRSCAVVSNSRDLTGKALGARINEHDVVLRLNNAPTTDRYQRDVGEYTDVRYTNWVHEGFREASGDTPLLGSWCWGEACSR
eukprot:5569628-Pyramimonas_sp.AAC.1